MTRLGVINLSCNNFSTFPVEALLSGKLTEIDLSSNKVPISLYVTILTLGLITCT